MIDTNLMRRRRHIRVCPQTLKGRGIMKSRMNSTNRKSLIENRFTEAERRNLCCITASISMKEPLTCMSSYFLGVTLVQSPLLGYHNTLKLTSASSVTNSFLEQPVIHGTLHSLLLSSYSYLLLFPLVRTNITSHQPHVPKSNKAGNTPETRCFRSKDMGSCMESSADSDSFDVLSKLILGRYEKHSSTFAQLWIHTQ
jgi:hypothetical protein